MGALRGMMDQAAVLGGIFNYIDLFSGGTLRECTLFAFGYYAVYYCIDYDANVDYDCSHHWSFCKKKVNMAVKLLINTLVI